LYYFFLFVKHGAMRFVFLSALFLSIATLTKLPYVVFGACVFIYALRRIRRKSTYKMALIYLIALLPPAAWYAWVIPGWNGNGIVYGIFQDQASWNRYSEIFEFHKKTMLPNRILNEWLTYLFFIGSFFVLFYSKFKKFSFWLLFAPT